MDFSKITTDSHREHRLAPMFGDQDLPQRHGDTEFWNYKHCHGELVESMFGVNGGYTMKWEMVRLGDVCEINQGYAFKSENFKSDGIPLIRISNIIDELVLIKDSIFIDKNDFDKYKNFHI